MDKIFCEGCQVDRSIDVLEFLASNAKRAKCGHCETVLMTEEEALDDYLAGMCYYT